jgi:hypothetical protein
MVGSLKQNNLRLFGEWIVGCINKS